MHAPEQVSENYLALQLGKIERTLLWLESNTPVEPGMDVADAALAAALSYLICAGIGRGATATLTWRIGSLSLLSGIRGLIKLSPIRQDASKGQIDAGLGTFRQGSFGQLMLPIALTGRIHNQQFALT